VLGARRDAREMRHALLGVSVDVVPTAIWGGGQRSGPWLFFWGEPSHRYPLQSARTN
jgi:hypothetical protein